MLNRGIEKEKYEGEFDEIMLDVFKEYLKTHKGRNRRTDVLRDFVEHNKSRDIRREVKSQTKNYRRVTSSMRQWLKTFGIVAEDLGDKFRLLFDGDDRYMVNLAKTCSDRRAGGNIAADIWHMMF